MVDFIEEQDILIIPFRRATSCQIYITDELKVEVWDGLTKGNVIKCFFVQIHGLGVTWCNRLFAGLWLLVSLGLGGFSFLDLY